MSTNERQQPPQTIADDMLNGVAEIAAFLGMSERQTYHALSQGYIDGCFQFGKNWKGLRSRIVEGINRKAKKTEAA